MFHLHTYTRVHFMMIYKMSQKVPTYPTPYIDLS